MSPFFARVYICRTRRLTQEVVVMNRNVLFAMGLTLLAPAAWAQTAAKLDPGSAAQVMRNQERAHREMQNAARYLDEAQRRTWLKSAANLAKLRVKLAEAWQSLGLSPQGADLVAKAYNPDLAARMHRDLARGKSDEEVAAMLQSSIRQKRYLEANQLLIDYERNRLRLGAAHR
ncbi:MAG: hypothetical protein WA961_02370 [Rhodanobacter sp.]